MHTIAKHVVQGFSLSTVLATCLVMSGQSLQAATPEPPECLPTVATHPDSKTCDRPGPLVQVSRSEIIAPDARSLTIVNETGQTIYYLYLTPTGDRNWGDDILGNRVLDVGDRMTLSVSGSCLVDVRAEIDYGVLIERHQVDTCATTQLPLANQDEVSQVPELQ